MDWQNKDYGPGRFKSHIHHTSRGTDPRPDADLQRTLNRISGFVGHVGTQSCCGPVMSDCMQVMPACPSSLNEGTLWTAPLC